MKTPIRLLIASLAILMSAKAETQQVHIKARFLEVPEGTLDGSTKIAGITNSPAQFVGILTDENAKTLMRTLQSQPGVEELAEPEVTTTSGRQTEMRSTQIITIITNFVFKENFDNPRSSSIIPQGSKVETGPILDVVPCVLSDGYTICLTVIPSLTEFLGYDKSTNTTIVYNSTGQKIDLPTISPALRVRRATANVNLWDGQTVVLAGMKTRVFDGEKRLYSPWDHFVKTKRTGDQPEEANKKVLADETSKDLLVLITVTLVDAAGNRVHSDEDLPFAKNSIPPQNGP